MARNQFYNQLDASVIVDGIVAENIADGDAIRVADAGASAAVTAGLGGALTSLSTDRTGSLELDLFPHSRTIGYLNMMRNAQGQGNGRLFDCTVTTGVGEVVRLNRCSMENVGTLSTGGKEGKARTYRILVEEILWPEDGDILDLAGQL